MYAMTNAEEASDHSVIQDTIVIYNSCARALVDTGASHSSISHTLMHTLGLEYTNLRTLLTATTPVQKDVILSHVCRGCTMVIAGYGHIFDLVLLNMGEFDVILGMNWLSAHEHTHAAIDTL